MKIRSCFVSNSSASCFIVDSRSVGWVKAAMIDTIAAFLDEKDGEDTSLHSEQARDLLARSFAVFQLDRSMPKNELRRLMCWAKIEDYVNEGDWGKVMVVDQDENSLQRMFGYDKSLCTAEDAVCRTFDVWPIRLEPDSRTWQEFMEDEG